MKTLKEVNLSGKVVLVRVDYNLPLKDGQILDDQRIRETLPTLNYLLENECFLILISHLGRPQEKDPRFSLKPIAQRLKEYLQREVILVEEPEQIPNYLWLSDILILENLRFFEGEERNDPDFAKKLANLSQAQYFCQEAFACLHRNQASISLLPQFLPSVAGFLVEKEVKTLSLLLENPERPFLVILGGAKVEDKISTIENLLKVADWILIGGKLSYTFLAAKKKSLGLEDLAQTDKIPQASKILVEAQRMGKEIILPLDHKIFKEKVILETDGSAIPQGWQGGDLGTKTINFWIKNYIDQAKTIFWNGPVGILEKEGLAEGTLALALALKERAKKKTLVVCGGGETILALKMAGVKDQISFVSTGGGATLEFLAGKKLPGLLAMEEK